MKSINKILFPTDFSEVAQAAFRYALRLADNLEVPMEVLHVVYPETEPLDFPVIATKAVQEKTEAAQEALKGFVELGLSQVLAGSTLENAPVTLSDIEVGVPGDLIPSIAGRDEADLIVMGTRREHSTFDRFFGSVTTNVIRKAHCPVWIVPPGANFTDFSSVVFATNLLEADPLHIVNLSEMLASHKPVIRVVHIETGEDEKTQIKMKQLESFFEERIPNLEVSFHQIKGDSVVDEISELTAEFSADLLVMYRSHRSLLSRLIEPSITRKMALHTEYPLLVMR